jgi:hypothetical protein
MSEDKDQQFVALLSGIPVPQAFEIAKYIDQQLKEPNDFIRDIAKLLGEDGLGFDGLSWTTDDFKNAIDQEKRSTAIAFVEWMQYLYIPYQMKGGLYYHRNDLLKDISQAKVFTTAQVYDLYINSLPKTKDSITTIS